MSSVFGVFPFSSFTTFIGTHGRHSTLHRLPRPVFYIFLAFANFRTDVLFLIEKPPGLLVYRTRKILSFSSAIDKVAWMVFFRFAVIVREGVPIPLDTVDNAVVFIWVASNFVHDLFVSCTYIFRVVIDFRSQYSGRLVELVVRSGWRYPINTDSLVYSDLFDCCVFLFTCDNRK